MHFDFDFETSYIGLKVKVLYICGGGKYGCVMGKKVSGQAIDYNHLSETGLQIHSFKKLLALTFFAPC